jgi:hypothetical protein
MGVKKVITNKGLELLASSSEATGQYYWIGHYALAYVPNEWQESDDQISQSMTKLTSKGDMIWNVFQGDLNGNGYYDGKSDGSVGGELFGLSMYNVNIKKHFRYLLDDDTKRNALVSWELDGTNPENTNLMKGYHTYLGTDGAADSVMPIPSPLYYLGDVTGGNSVDNFKIKFSDPRYNGTEVYPSTEYNTDGSTTVEVPLVSNDPREYLDYDGQTSSPASPGFFYEDEISPFTSGDVTTWYDAAGTKLTTEYADKFYQLHTISNYNRFHAPVGEVGNILNSQLLSRNLAKTTKLFPISNYQVMNTESGIAFDGENREVATGIKLSINLDIAPRNKTMGYLDGVYDETKDLTLQDNYDNVAENGASSDYNKTHTSFKFNRIGIYAVPMRKAPYTVETENIAGSKVEVQFEINPDAEPVLFAVVDWEQAIYMSDTGDGLSNFAADFNINLDSPTFDSSVVRDTAIFYNLYKDSSTTWYENQLIANAQTSHAITEIGLEVANLKNKGNSDDCCPPVNLDNKYASKDHTHEGLGLRNLKDANNAVDGGLKGIDILPEGSVVDGSAYTLGIDSVILGKDNASTADYSTIAGGKDNLMYPSAMLIDLINPVEYSMIGSGTGNIIKSSNAFIGSGYNNIVDSGGASSFIGAGSGNIIESIDWDTVDANIPSESAIIAGTGNKVSSNATLIGVGHSNIVYNNSEYGVILSGHQNTISSSHATILNGTNNVVHTNAVYASVLSGNTNVIGSTDPDENSTYSVIVGGNNGTIVAQNSSILGGDGNIIQLNSTDIGTINAIQSSSILGGYNNLIEKTIGDTNMVNSSIGSGTTNIIRDAGANVAILTGTSNLITIFNYDSEESVLSNEQRMPAGSAVISGQSNAILGTGNSFIGTGSANVITEDFLDDGITLVTSANSSIVSGDGNIIEGSASSAILTGQSNQITRMDDNGDNAVNNTILNGFGNIIAKTGNSRIGGGQNNYITTSGFSNIDGGDGNSISVSPFSGIVNGDNNSIITGTFNVMWGKRGLINQSNHSNILGGVDNTIYDSYTSTIVSGENNSIGLNGATAGGLNNSIFGSYLSEITSSNYVTIVGGNQSVIDESDNSVILGGLFNDIDNSDYSSILGGVSNKTENANYSAVVGGQDAIARNYGEVTHSNGGFNSEVGTCQNSVFLYRNLPTAYTQNSYIALTLDGSTEQVNVSDNMVMAGTITVTASANDGAEMQYSHYSFMTGSTGVTSEGLIQLDILNESSSVIYENQSTGVPGTTTPWFYIDISGNFNIELFGITGEPNVKVSAKIDSTILNG